MVRLTSAAKKKLLGQRKPINSDTPQEILDNPSGTIRNPDSDSKRAPIQKNVVTGANSGGVLSRDESMDPLLSSAKAAGVDVAGRQQAKARAEAGIIPFSRGGETDMDRQKAVQETLNSDTQAPLEIQMSLRDVERGVNQRRETLIKQNRSSQIEELAKQKGLDPKAFGVDSEGKVRINMNSFLDGASGGFEVINNKNQFVFKGLSSDPKIAEIQKNYIGAVRANSDSAKREIEAQAQALLGVDDLSDITVSDEDEAEFQKEVAQAQLWGAKNASGAISDKKFNQELAYMTQKRQELENQRQEELQKRNFEIDQELSDAKANLSTRIVGNGITPSKQKIIDKGYKDLEKRAKKKREAQEKDVSIAYEDSIRSLDENIAKRRKKIDDLDLSDKIAAEKEAWIQSEQEKNPALTTKFLSNKYDAINKYDADSQESAAIGLSVDGALESDDDDATKFATVNEKTGDIDETYKAFESRVGEFKAKELKNAYLQSKGWDDLTINSHNYAQDFYDLYSGKEDTVGALANYVSKSKKMGVPDQYIADKLDLLKVGGTYDPDLLDLYTEKLRPKEEKLSEGDLKAQFLAGEMDADKEAEYLANSARLKGLGTSITPQLTKNLANDPGMFEGLPASLKTDLYKAGYVPERDMGPQTFLEAMMTQPSVYGLPTKLVDSEKEREKFENAVKLGMAEGKTLPEIRDTYNGFILFDKADKELANSLKSYLFMLEDIEPSDYANLARQMNAGQSGKAIDRIEKRVLDDANPEFVKNKTLTTETLQKANDVVDLLAEVDPKKLGVFDATTLKWSKTITGNDPEDIKAQRLQSKLVAMIQPYRKENLGSAVTETELKALEDMIASIKDQPQILAAKVQEFAQSSLMGYNAARLTSGLPEVDMNDVVFPERLESVYRREAGIDPLSALQEVQKTQQERKAKKVESSFNISDDQFKIFKTLTAEQLSELSDEEFEALENYGNDDNMQSLNRPERNKNPINIKKGGLADEFALKVGGKVVTDEQGHLVFKTPEDGIKAGKADLHAKVNGGSRHLGDNPTLAELGKVFAEDLNWTNGVASILGVDPNTRTQDIDFEELFKAVSRQEGGARLLTQKL